ncbi:MAG: ParB/Srx family N-terminal domain-containing protein [Oscillospiraceae bacterium]|jgi:ParB-like chromosome segregation protein Spo0J|nr:ParB/Srx family N-terminal domain-containing protein [Oscillospiraceae bacterium]
MKNSELFIEQIPIGKLTPYAKNSKIHTKAQIEHIANSIKNFGFNDPLAIAGVDNIVLEGNGRIEAAKRLGITSLPCVRLDHLGESEQRAYVIAHNALNLETGFDDAILFTELEALQDYNFSDYGLNTDKYLTTLDSLQKKELTPIQRAHYLISVDINHNDKIIETIAVLRNIEGVEIRETCN